MGRWPSEVEAAYASDVDRMLRWFSHKAKEEKRAMDAARSKGRRN